MINGQVGPLGRRVLVRIHTGKAFFEWLPRSIRGVGFSVNIEGNILVVSWQDTEITEIDFDAQKQFMWLAIDFDALGAGVLGAELITAGQKLCRLFTKLLFVDCDKEIWPIVCDYLEEVEVSEGEQDWLLTFEAQKRLRAQYPEIAKHVMDCPHCQELYLSGSA